MNRRLLIVLVLVAGLTVYLSGQDEDDLLASPSAEQAQNKRGKGQVSGDSIAERKPALANSKSEPIEPWVVQALMDGVNRWQQRGGRHAPVNGRYPPVTAWAGVNSPPPPAPRTPRSQDMSPPPPPTAPRFPHAWVGRFNDEAQPQALGASLPVLASGARVVLTSPQNTWVVRVGDVIEGQWRIDRIQDRTMSLTYLPLQQQQTVVMR